MMVATEVVGWPGELPKTDAWSRFADACAPEVAGQFRIGTPSQARRYLTDQLPFASPDAVILVARGGDATIAGTATLQPLAWDSAIYGMPMGRVGWLLALGDTAAQRLIKQQLVAGILRQAQDRGYRHLMARVAAEDYGGLHALELAGFCGMDVQITLACAVATLRAARPAWPDLRPFLPSDLPALKEMSARAYPRSRLFADPDLPVAATERLHEMWVENDCRGRAAAVLVAHLNDEPVGYVACLLHAAQPEHGLSACGDIDLITVSPPARGKGIGLSLVRAALDWFRPRVDRVTVKTQVTNYPAIAMYERAGFVVEQAQITLHRLCR